MAKAKPDPLLLPTGEDLAKMLQFAYPGCAYALYGLQVDQIKIESDPNLMGVPDENTLVWMDTGVSAPTLSDLAKASANYQGSIAVPLNIKAFELGFYNDMDLREILVRANPIAFTILIRLLDGIDPNNPDFAPVQSAIDQLRASITPDFTAAQINRLTDLARVNGLIVKF